jgi:hypothetical protein
VARSERCHGEPPRRRARSPQGERAAVERLHCGAQICGAASGPCRVNGSRGLRPHEAGDLAGLGQGAGVPGALTADGPREKHVSSPFTAPFCCELGLGLGFAGLARGACVLSPRKGLNLSVLAFFRVNTKSSPSNCCSKFLPEPNYT